MGGWGCTLGVVCVFTTKPSGNAVCEGNGMHVLLCYVMSVVRLCMTFAFRVGTKRDVVWCEIVHTTWLGRD